MREEVLYAYFNPCEDSLTTEATIFSNRESDVEVSKLPQKQRDRLNSGYLGTGLHQVVVKGRDGHRKGQQSEYKSCHLCIVTSPNMPHYDLVFPHQVIGVPRS